MAAISVIGQVVGEQDVELGLYIIVVHLVQKIHGLGSSPLPGYRA